MLAEASHREAEQRRRGRDVDAPRYGAGGWLQGRRAHEAEPDLLDALR